MADYQRRPAHRRSRAGTEPRLPGGPRDALGFVERQGNRYSNASVSTAFLAGAGEPDLRPFLRFWNRLSYPRWTRYEEAVRTDKMIFGEPAFSEQEQRLYSDGVEAV